MDVFIDFLLDLTVKLFSFLKKKSKSTYWTNMELLNSQELKKSLLKEIIEKLTCLGVDIPENTKNEIEKESK